MLLRFKEVERVLFTMYDVQETHRKAFHSRINNFRLFGIPEGVEIGRGKVAEYGWLQLYQLAIAVEFSELGMHPKTIQRYVNGPGNRWAVINASLEKVRTGKGGRQMLWVLDPSMMDATGFWSFGQVRVFPAEEVAKHIGRGLTDKGRSFVIDLTRLVERMKEAIAKEIEKEER